MKNTVLLQASSRSNGDSRTIINYLNATNQFDIIDLRTKNIGHFDYDFNNVNDDFIGLMAEIIEKYDTLVFVTPVYWYTMSGILKVFFDRFSDLLKTHKELGRKLRGKQMAMLSCSNSNDLKEGFTMPFTESANYLGMYYLGDIHTWVVNGVIPDEVKINIDGFKRTIS
ncbi:MAG TPA: NADPH-dependent oxidoreductase [Flavobacteriia bacterium]|nr:NADPH-dependent oxidoreductase [Flavobacteriia bacterium]